MSTPQEVPSSAKSASSCRCREVAPGKYLVGVVAASDVHLVDDCHLEIGCFVDWNSARVGQEESWGGRECAHQTAGVRVVL